MTITLNGDGLVHLKGEFINSLEYTLQIAKEIWIESDLEIREVKLEECEIEHPESFFPYFFSLANSSTRILLLDLDSSFIGDNGMFYLCSILSNPIFSSLQKISLRRNHISAIGLNHLLQYLVFKQHLESLYLSQNQLQDDGAILLAEYLPLFQNLKTLHLSYNGIGIKGAAIFAPYLGLEKCSIESFSFMSNPVKLEGLKMILNSLALNRNLKSLIIGNTPPFTFRVSDADTHDESFHDILSTYLSSNPLLQQIVVFGLDGPQILEKGMKRNTLLESLTIPSTISPIIQDLSPILKFMKFDNALEYIKITDLLETGKSLKTEVRNKQLADAIKVKFLLPLLEDNLPYDLWPVILGSFLCAFRKQDKDVLLSMILARDFIELFDRKDFSAMNFLRLSYQTRKNFPTVI